MPTFESIPKFTRHASYRIDVAWSYVEKYLAEQMADGGIDMDPDFQRAHVWTEKQQILYIEFVLRGGMSGKDLYWNCAGWNSVSQHGPYVLVDGKQRLTAVRRFLADEIPAFGTKKSEYSDKLDMMVARFSWWVNDLPTRAEVLEWYLQLNAGGTQHTEAELDKVREMLRLEAPKPARRRSE